MKNPASGYRSRLLLAVAMLGAPVAAASAQGAEVLNNESVMQMVVGKVPKDLILTKIRTTKATFDLTPAGLIGLHANKVGDDIIKAMFQSLPSGAAKETLDNDAVIQMVNGQLSKDVILLKIQHSKAEYDLTTSGIIRLNQSKVSQDVIKAMMATTSGTPPAKRP